jgi:hypothetical protein
VLSSLYIKFKSFLGLKVLWKDIERFDPLWRERIELMARNIVVEDSEVLDIGCGPMWLKDYLPDGVKYYGLDYKKRGRDCLVCDLNRDEYPNIDCPLFFISGCLEYIEDVDKFLNWICGRTKKCILSYCAIDDFPDAEMRLRRGWANSLSINSLVEKFEAGGMRLGSLAKTSQNNVVMVFIK